MTEAEVKSKEILDQWTCDVCGSPAESIRHESGGGSSVRCKVHMKRLASVPLPRLMAVHSNGPVNGNGHRLGTKRELLTDWLAREIPGCTPKSEESFSDACAKLDNVVVKVRDEVGRKMSDQIDRDILGKGKSHLPSHISPLPYHVLDDRGIKFQVLTIACPIDLTFQTVNHRES